MKYILILSGLLSISVMAQGQNQLLRYKQPKQSKIDKDVWDVTDNLHLPLTYQQPKEQQAALAKEAELKMWSTEQRATKEAALPTGGALSSLFYRRTIGGANTNVFTIIVQRNGQEILRHQPEPSIGSPYSAAGASVFINNFIIPLYEPLAAGDRVFIVDDVMQVRFEYEVRPL